MRVRTVIAGVAAGWLCLVALQFRYLRIEPSKFVPEWTFASQAAQLPGWISTVILVFCGLTVFAAGWVAARWNWANTWRRSLQAGAGAGLLAGCLIFDFVGAFWSGVRGQSEILRNFYTPVEEAVGTKIINEGVLQTGSLLYINFALILLVCAVLAGLGGMISAFVDRKDFWGSDPRSPEGWLFRLPAYLLSFFGFLNLLVSVAVIRLMVPKALVSSIVLEIESGVKSNVGPSAQFFQLFSNLALWSLAFLPLGITWGWILRRWLVNRHLPVSSILWILFSMGLYLTLFYYIAPGALSNVPDLLYLSFACLAGVFIGFVAEERSHGFPYRLSDWVGYGVSYGILGGTQIMAGVLSYGLALSLISIASISRLINGTPDPAEQSPAQQVHALYNLLYVSSTYSILGSLIIGLLLAGLISFLRTLLDVRDAASRWDS